MVGQCGCVCRMLHDKAAQAAEVPSACPQPEVVVDLVLKTACQVLRCLVDKLHHRPPDHPGTQTKRQRAMTATSRPCSLTRLSLRMC